MYALELQTKGRNTKKHKKTQGCNIFINEDFSHETMQYQKKLWEEFKNLKSQVKIVYLNYRSIVVGPNKNNTG